MTYRRILQMYVKWRKQQQMLILSSCGANQIDTAEWCKQNHDLRLVYK